ncbi:MAG: hypothetical protein KGI56_01550 [Acidobacteriota bacterium]|nr:hypothetical protein [Acidobacteriota bacterium]
MLFKLGLTGQTGLYFVYTVFFVIFIIPLIMAIRASIAATKYKTYIFVITYFEWWGWILCLTIIGIPLGLGLVLGSQAARVLVDIEANTRVAANQLSQGKK